MYELTSNSIVFNNLLFGDQTSIMQISKMKKKCIWYAVYIHNIDLSYKSYLNLKMFMDIQHNWFTN